MITLGKRVSSCVAVAIVWVGGSVSLQVVLGFLFAIVGRHAERSASEAASIELWTAAAMPLIACVGGSAAVWILRQVSGWPKLPVPALFLRGLVFSIFALVLLPTHSILLVATAANLLSIAGAALATWREAARNELGTHLFPGSAKTEK